MDGRQKDLSRLPNSPSRLTLREPDKCKAAVARHGGAEPNPTAINFAGRHSDLTGNSHGLIHAAHSRALIAAARFVPV
jgi:hypothetical protein